jgi:GTP pyrophosphokinase
MEYNFQINNDDIITKQYLIQIIQSKYRKEEIAQIERDLNLAYNAHHGQNRADSSPYIIHPMRVSLLLEKYEHGTTSDMVEAALLHDTLEDTELTEKEVYDIFKEPVTTYLKALTIYRPADETPMNKMLSKIRKWQVIMAESHEIRAIKTFDYLDNMISWKFIPRDKSEILKIPRWLMEAETMYLPLAQITNEEAFRLMKLELEYYLSKGYKIGNWFSG